jgi:hypothetical protein
MPGFFSSLDTNEVLSYQAQVSHAQSWPATLALSEGTLRGRRNRHKRDACAIVGLSYQAQVSHAQSWPATLALSEASMAYHGLIFSFQNVS